MSDDRWRDTYDAWKLASPPHYDGPDEPDEPECDHWDFEVNFEGLAECMDCGKTWWASSAQVLTYDSERRRLARVWRRENSWWRLAWRWLTAWFPGRKLRHDDDIPF